MAEIIKFIRVRDLHAATGKTGECVILPRPSELSLTFCTLWLHDNEIKLFSTECEVPSYSNGRVDWISSSDTLWAPVCHWTWSDTCIVLEAVASNSTVLSVREFFSHKPSFLTTVSMSLHRCAVFFYYA